MQFHILVRAFNAERYISKCLRSLVRQTHEEWDALIVLDAPTDDTYDAVKPFLEDRRFRCIVRQKRRGCAYNLYHGIMELNQGAGEGTGLYDDRDVVAIVDGDDWVPVKALRIVKETYEKNRLALVTYGSYSRVSDGKKTRTSSPYPEGSNVRKARWRASHLKTFRWSLVQEIEKKWFLDKAGEWLPAASDLALMIPLIRSVGLTRCVHIPKITYRYRDNAKGNCNRKLQWRCEQIVRYK